MSPSILTVPSILLYSKPQTHGTGDLEIALFLILHFLVSGTCCCTIKIPNLGIEGLDNSSSFWDCHCLMGR